MIMKIRNILKKFGLKFDHDQLYEDAYKILKRVGDEEGKILPLIMSESNDHEFIYSYLIGLYPYQRTISWTSLREHLKTNTLEAAFKTTIKRLKENEERRKERIKKENDNLKSPYRFCPNCGYALLIRGATHE